MRTKCAISRTQDAKDSSKPVLIKNVGDDGETISRVKNATRTGLVVDPFEVRHQEYLVMKSGVVVHVGAFVCHLVSDLASQ